MLKGKERTKAIKWVCNELSRLLRCEIGEEEASNLLSMKTKHMLESHVKSLIDFSSPKAEPFLIQILKFWEDAHIDEENKSSDDKKSMVESQDSPTKSGKKKTNFVPLFGTDGKDRTSAKLPGRHACECQASKHDLVNNCLQCGRIVCEQEGSGPCFFCGSLVCNSKEQEILSSNSKKGQRLRDHLMSLSQVNPGNSQDLKPMEEEAGDDDDLKRAIKQKERLLEYDKDSVRRTRVIDDENDYFSTSGNKWLTEDEKKLLKSKEDEIRSQRFASRLGPMKVTFDFGNRRIIEAEREDYDATEDDAVMAANFGTNGRSEKSTELDECDQGSKPFELHAEFIQEATEEKEDSNNSEGRRQLRVLQDGDLQMTLDQGKAISMHQPWASLLVLGIKKHEGRKWYTNHRGPLWIASTAKRSDEAEIANVEAMYRALNPGKRLKFPDTYPPGLLLGRVVVADCLPQEEYKIKYPGGESDSPYVFICENPKEMKVYLPMKGQHKIYSLEKHIHTGAKKMLSWKEPRL